ncbi:probable LRR receptor-like serine/threonine-protein kinase At1g07650 isoform X2 [Magnolia sinica]|nr:probable LRR receptor-like serine/threonine-protein kinase At1g07650 isoform X2 [Magnolia sinica]
MPNSELYTKARLSPISLTYYGLCLHNGNYTVKLHFAEIMFMDDKTYSSLGKRIFDVYIQGQLVLKDFNIKDEAGGSGQEVVKNFTVPVTNYTLEIRLCWAGKGTQIVPEKGTYGPLISAISVDPEFTPSQSTSKSSKDISTGVVVGIVTSVLFLTFLFLVFLWRKDCLAGKNRKGYLGSKSTTDQDLSNLLLRTGSFALRHIRAATNNFDILNKIGEGGFGSVYRVYRIGLLSDGTSIAVKQLSSKSSQGNREFVNEIGLISALQHPNLVKLYGCCIEGDQPLLVYEYMENNSLARALFGIEEHQLQLDWPTRLKICVGIARGLAYLHEESKLKVIHRDIKATNVLLDRDLNPKISDFGLARLCEGEKTHISTRIAGTIGYMAPEYAVHGRLTEKADIYSFGVVTLEIVSGKSITNFTPEGNHIHLVDWAYFLQERGRLLELVDPKLGSEFNEKEAIVMINVALLCTNASPVLRPTMSAVVSMLEGKSLIQDPLSDSSFSSDDLKFKASSSSYEEIQSQSSNPSLSQTQTVSKVQLGAGTPTSASSLYPVNSDSQNWKNR